MTEKEKTFQINFINPIQSTGRLTLILATGCLFIPGLYLYFVHGLLPPLDATVRSLIAVWAFMIVMGVIEPIVYFPILGLGGTYMSFLVGNVLNLRVPVSAAVQQVVGTEEGTPEAEIASTLGIAGSVIGSELVMIAGVVLFLPFLSNLQESGTAVSIAMQQVLPALFGALGGVFLLKTPKLGIVPIGLGFIIAFIKKDLSPSIVIPPMVIISIVTARIMYKKKWVKGDGIM